MTWNLESYPTTVLNERMWNFKGQNILCPLLHIFRGHDPQPLWSYAPGLSWLLFSWPIFRARQFLYEFNSDKYYENWSTIAEICVNIKAVYLLFWGIGYFVSSVLNASVARYLSFPLEHNNNDEIFLDWRFTWLQHCACLFRHAVARHGVNVCVVFNA